MPFGVNDKVKMDGRSGVVKEIRGDGNSLVVEFEDGKRTEVAHTVLK